MTPRNTLALLAMASVCFFASAFGQAPSHAPSEWDQVLQRLGPPQDLAIEPDLKARLGAASAPAPAATVTVEAKPVIVEEATPIEVSLEAVKEEPVVNAAPVVEAVKPVIPAVAVTPQNDLPISFGRFISADRDALYNSGKYVELNYVDEPMQNVLRRLARAAGINFIMPKIDGTKVSLSQKGNPFSIMESMIESQGMGLVRRGDTWLITALDRVNLKPEVYKLTHIHLDREFSFRDNTASSAMGGAGAASSQGGMQGTQGMQGGMQGGAQGGGFQGSTVTNPANLTAPRSVEDRSSGNSQLLATLEKILEFGMDNSMDPDSQKVNINDKGAATGERGGAKRSNSKAIYSYDPDANSLFVVATEQQHEWVKKWVGTIDQPTRNIQIEIQFISTGKSNGKSVGVDWTGGTNGSGFGSGLGFHVKDAPSASSTGTATASSGSITFGALNGLKAPISSILSADQLDLRLKMLLSNTDTRTTKKPLLTTLTNREVLINNTQNQPVVLANNSGSTTTGGGGGSTTNSTSNAISNENIGTVTRILPRIISGDLISLSVNIDITNLLRTTIINGNEYPIIAKTGFTNEVKVRSGYSVVVGGLEEMISKEAIHKMPLLGDIPFFGFAFKDLVKGDDISNLSLVITVRIIDESGKEYHAGDAAPAPTAK